MDSFDIMIKKIICVLIVVSTLLALALPVYASSSAVKVNMRDDNIYFCVAPADAEYCYYYFVSGSQQDFTWQQCSYMFIWSKEKLSFVDGEIIFTEPFYFYPHTNQQTLYNTIFGSAPDSANLKMCSGSFSYGTIDIIYSNTPYYYDDHFELSHWPFAIDGSDSDAVRHFLYNIYTGLTKAKIHVFGTNVSAFEMIVGPFVISIGIMILRMIFGIGGEAGSLGVRVSKNHLKKVKREKAKAAANSKEKKES